MVIGNNGIGKTSLIKCFITEQNQNRHRNMRSEHAICTTKLLQLQKNNVTVHVKDVAGNLSTQQLIASHMRDADAVILCYSITSKASFDDIDDWLEALQKQQNGRSLPIALIGLNSDLATTKRQVPQSCGYSRQNSIGGQCILFAETTTFSDDVSQVQQIFSKIAKKVLEKREIDALNSP